MNPWSLYQHKPQLLQALVVAVSAWSLRRKRRGDAAQLVFVMVLAWATLGVLDWFVYAFDDQLPQAVNPIQQVFEWLRLLFVVVGAVALAKHLEIAGER